VLCVPLLHVFSMFLLDIYIIHSICETLRYVDRNDKQINRESGIQLFGITTAYKGDLKFNKNQRKKVKHVHCSTWRSGQIKLQHLTVSMFHMTTTKHNNI
jgi:hypothetical protein